MNKIYLTEHEANVLLHATERTRGLHIEIGLINNELFDTPENQWAIDLIRKSRDQT